eukprot:1192164-Prorocentrum_minimum.AAC.1
MGPNEGAGYGPPSELADLRGRGTPASAQGIIARQREGTDVYPRLVDRHLRGRYGRRPYGHEGQRVSGLKSCWIEKLPGWEFSNWGVVGFSPLDRDEASNIQKGKLHSVTISQAAVGRAQESEHSDVSSRVQELEVLLSVDNTSKSSSRLRGRPCWEG